MVNIRLLITISFLFVSHLIFSQKEANIWYFGNGAGIDFNSVKPTVLTNGKMISTEGCVSQSTYGGKLLFYTDGNTVWDSTHNIMLNGKNLNGSTSSTQSSIIIPKPFSSKRFYLFTVDNVAGAEGISYSEIDMRYNKGKGDIVPSSKNTKLLAPACEKISAVKHANGFDYWIIVHLFNSDLIYAYKISYLGISKTPVISKTEFNIGGDYSHTLGYMKFSPDARKIAYANYGMDSTVIGDFDANTGIVSNIWTFNNKTAYGIEFSPQSKYLYVGEFSTKRIYQYDAKALSKTEFELSKTLVADNYSNDLGALQLATDGKIYISVTGSNYLQVINFPDSFATKTLPQKDYLYLNGRTCLLGLPNFQTSIFNKKTFNVHRNCLNDSTFFTISNTNDLDSLVWYFGDTLSGVNNYSKKITNVFHIYKKTGYYTVWLKYYYKKTIEFAVLKFYVRNPKPLLGNDTVFCNSFKLTLSPQKDYSTYLWNDNNANTKSIIVSKKGSYTIKVQDSAGCISSDTIEVSNPVVIAKIKISDTVACAKNNVFNLMDNSSYADDSFFSCHWDFGDGTNLPNKFVKKSYSNAGVFKIKLVVESKNHCKSNAEKSVSVVVNPIATFATNSPCFPAGVQFTNQSTLSVGKIISTQWDFGDKTYSMETNPLKFYVEHGKYNVKLLVISDKGCIDSISKHRGVWVREKPMAAFSFSEISLFNNGDRTIQFINNSSDDVTAYFWDFGKGKQSIEKNPILNYTDSGVNKFTLKVTNSSGCDDSYSLTTYQKFYFNLPNAFSPNGNNLNETFGPVSSIYLNSYEMKIFNRWGEMVFETKDLSVGWDGNANGSPCEAGMYICQISVTPFNGILQRYEESFRLIR